MLDKLAMIKQQQRNVGGGADFMDIEEIKQKINECLEEFKKRLEDPHTININNQEVQNVFKEEAE